MKLILILFALSACHSAKAQDSLPDFPRSYYTLEVKDTPDPGTPAKDTIPVRFIIDRPGYALYGRDGFLIKGKLYYWRKKKLTPVPENWNVITTKERQ